MKTMDMLTETEADQGRIFGLPEEVDTEAATRVAWKVVMDKNVSPREYQCEIRLQEEDDGRVSAYAPPLPGVASYGNSLDEAVENIGEALQAAIESYEAASQAIPWVAEPEPATRDEKRRWIHVNV